MSNKIPKIVKGLMAYWFDEKFKLPKFRFLNFKSRRRIHRSYTYVTQLFQNWTQKHMEQ